MMVVALNLQYLTYHITDQLQNILETLSMKTFTVFVLLIVVSLSLGQKATPKGYDDPVTLNTPGFLYPGPAFTFPISPFLPAGTVVTPLCYKVDSFGGDWVKVQTVPPPFFTFVGFAPDSVLDCDGVCKDKFSLAFCIP
eukprot:TRINITY_DN484_c1_g1_i4.p8 TRINITY_DN484_c1_g1~~TRINITY_DN484_c1_g1_i4.p8  ORF type:complete len:139 (-),score=11.37 TRINITY_DN484_c1_g1_i4:396-812(-)